MKEIKKDKKQSFVAQGYFQRLNVSSHIFSKQKIPGRHSGSCLLMFDKNSAMMKHLFGCHAK